MTRRSLIGGAVAVLAGAALLAVVGWTAFEPLRSAVSRLGWFGPASVAVLYAVLAALLVPGVLLSVGCGMLFGLWPGVFTAVVGSNLGAAAGFLLARTLFRARAERAMRQHLVGAGLDMALARDPFKWTLMLRLSPIFPYSVLNVLLGATSIPAGRYAFATFLGMFPGTLLFVALGSTCASCLAGPAGWSWPVPSQLWPLTAVAAVTSVFVGWAHHAIGVERRG